MARTKNVDGVSLPLTAEEETARDAEELAWTSDSVKREARREISRLESLESRRRLSEAMGGEAGGSPAGRQWLKANRDAIAIERAKL